MTRVRAPAVASKFFAAVLSYGKKSCSFAAWNSRNADEICKNITRLTLVFVFCSDHHIFPEENKLGGRVRRLSGLWPQLALVSKANPQTVSSFAREKKPNRELRSREEIEAF